MTQNKISKITRAGILGLASIVSAACNNNELVKRGNIIITAPDDMSRISIHQHRPDYTWFGTDGEADFELVRKSSAGKANLSKFDPSDYVLESVEIDPSSLPGNSTVYRPGEAIGDGVTQKSGQEVYEILSQHSDEIRQFSGDASRVRIQSSTPTTTPTPSPTPSATPKTTATPTTEEPTIEDLADPNKTRPTYKPMPVGLPQKIIEGAMRYIARAGTNQPDVCGYKIKSVDLPFCYDEATRCYASLISDGSIELTSTFEKVDTTTFRSIKTKEGQITEVYDVPLDNNDPVSLSKLAELGLVAKTCNDAAIAESLRSYAVRPDSKHADATRKALKSLDTKDYMTTPERIS